MSNLSLMSDDDIRYICSVIGENPRARSHAIDYFMVNHKEFVKIRPGFRMNKASLSKLDISSLFFIYRNRGFINFFIEKIVSDWLDQIKEHFAKCLNDGDSEELALVNTLPFCFFADNIRLYFKLTRQEHSEETIAVLELAVQKLKQNDETLELQKKELESKDALVSKLRVQIESSSALSEGLRQKLTQVDLSTKELHSKAKEIHILKLDIEEKTTKIERLLDEIEGRDKSIHDLNAKLADTEKSMQLLEEQIREEISRQNEELLHFHIKTSLPKRPVDMVEFTEHLQYNFEAIGVVSNKAFFPLLISHMSNTLFEGIPIIISRHSGMSLIRCVSNAIAGTSDVEILSFHEGITIEGIETFMLSPARVLCLDNFIGNFNETALIPLLDNHRGKIIFLTYSYDRTMKYVSPEFLKYVRHLNLNRITTFSNPAELTEDPSIIEEEEYTSQLSRPDSRYSLLMREILVELNYPKSVIEYMCATTISENDLCGKLAFDVLPYCVDVLHIVPYSISERLNKYAGANGRCSYKNLLREWFV